MQNSLLLIGVAMVLSGCLTIRDERLPELSEIPSHRAINQSLYLDSQLIAYQKDKEPIKFAKNTSWSLGRQVKQIASEYGYTLVASAEEADLHALVTLELRDSGCQIMFWKAACHTANATQIFSLTLIPVAVFSEYIVRLHITD